jgi:hypothetical protein
VGGLAGGGRRRAPPRRLPPPRRQPPPPRYYKPRHYGPPPRSYYGPSSIRRVQKPSRRNQRGGFLTDSINTGILDHYGEHKHRKKHTKEKQKGGYIRKRVKNAFW